MQITEILSKGEGTVGQRMDLPPIGLILALFVEEKYTWNYHAQNER